MCDSRDYTRKACLKLYFHCHPLEKSNWKVQNVKNIKKKTDTKCHKNQMSIYYQTIWKSLKKKTLRTLLVKKLVFNNELEMLRQ